MAKMGQLTTLSFLLFSNDSLSLSLSLSLSNQGPGYEKNKINK